MGRALRITGGVHRGRRLRVVPGDATRPALDAHRESLFAILEADLENARVLDLFAGTGAFVLEAISRGAREAVAVERARAALGVLRENVRDVLGAAAPVQVVSGDSYRRPHLVGTFDVVFVAPPYPHFTERGDDVRALVARLVDPASPLLTPDGLVIVQYESGDYGPAQAPDYEALREKHFGRTTFLILGTRPGCRPASS